MKRRCFLVFLVVAVAVYVSTATVDLGGPLGAYGPIRDLNSDDVVTMAKFAIDEYNKKSNANLKLKGIVSGEEQIVEGVNYKLVLDVAVDGGDSKKYEAIVWDRPWIKFRALTSFKPVKG